MGPCPEFKTLATKDNGQTICAYYWTGIGDDWAINACNGISYYMTDGASFQNIGSGFTKMGSYWVMPGCTLWLFQNSDWTGERYAAPAGLVTNNPFYPRLPFATLPYGPGGYKCSCADSPLDCIPSDGWETVFSYNNTKSSVTVSMKYEKSIGTTHSETVTKAMSQSITVEAEISASFGDLFSA